MPASNSLGIVVTPSTQRNPTSKQDEQVRSAVPAEFLPKTEQRLVVSLGNLVSLGSVVASAYYLAALLVL